MHLREIEVELPAATGGRSSLANLARSLDFRLAGKSVPLRVSVTRSDDSSLLCELGVLDGTAEHEWRDIDPIFRFEKRKAERAEKFNAVFLVPTGVGAEIGGHAGDATPAAKLIASACDSLVTHPNVVNASDINEIPDNALYVEGSVISRLLMGTVGLQPVRSNRLLVVIDAHRDALFANAAVNAVNAARSSYGLDCPRVVQLDPPIRMTATYTESGRAAGVVEGFERLFAVLEEQAGEYDAVAVSSVISVPPEYHDLYFQAGGEMVNPWGGVEAMLTHAISSLFNVPSAHSPMFETQDISNKDPGVVDSRMAAEAISLTFLQCILKGLQKSPRIVTDNDGMKAPGVFTASDISCLVIPDGCIGLPTLAALEQGIPVIAVRENRNLMRNDLSALPWVQGQLLFAENYWEAAGLMLALKTGIAPESVRRPLRSTDLVKHEAQVSIRNGEESASKSASNQSTT